MKKNKNFYLVLATLLCTLLLVGVAPLITVGTLILPNPTTIVIDNPSRGNTKWNWTFDGTTYTITGDVTVVGESPEGDSLVFDIADGHTVTWSANYTGGEETSEIALIEVTGNGVFMVDSGIIDAKGGNSIAIRSGGEAEIIVLGDSAISAQGGAILAKQATVTIGGNSVIKATGLLTFLDGELFGNAIIAKNIIIEDNAQLSALNGAAAFYSDALEINGGALFAYGDGIGGASFEIGDDAEPELDAMLNVVFKTQDLDVATGVEYEDGFDLEAYADGGDDDDGNADGDDDDEGNGINGILFAWDFNAWLGRYTESGATFHYKEDEQTDIIVYPDEIIDYGWRLIEQPIELFSPQLPSHQPCGVDIFVWYELDVNAGSFYIDMFGIGKPLQSSPMRASDADPDGGLDGTDGPDDIDGPDDPGDPTEPGDTEGPDDLDDIDSLGDPDDLDGPGDSGDPADLDGLGGQDGPDDPGGQDGIDGSDNPDSQADQGIITEPTLSRTGNTYRSSSAATTNRNAGIDDAREKPDPEGAIDPDDGDVDGGGAASINANPPDDNPEASGSMGSGISPVANPDPPAVASKQTNTPLAPRTNRARVSYDDPPEFDRPRPTSTTPTKSASTGYAMGEKAQAEPISDTPLPTAQTLVDTRKPEPNDLPGMTPLTMMMAAGGAAVLLGAGVALWFIIEKSRFRGY